MTLAAHLVELSEKHKNLEHRIGQELGRPGVDETEIRRLKQKKLELKDQIVRLREKSGLS
ncbi:MAG: YdcH family protein [Hyphomicrobiaceae bacterium]